MFELFYSIEVSNVTKISLFCNDVHIYRNTHSARNNQPCQTALVSVTGISVTNLNAEGWTESRKLQGVWWSCHHDLELTGKLSQLYFSHSKNWSWTKEADKKLDKNENDSSEYITYMLLDSFNHRCNLELIGQLRETEIAAKGPQGNQTRAHGVPQHSERYGASEHNYWGSLIHHMANTNQISSMLNVWTSHPRATASGSADHGIVCDTAQSRTVNSSWLQGCLTASKLALAVASQQDILHQQYNTEQYHLHKDAYYSQKILLINNNPGHRTDPNYWLLTVKLPHSHIR